MIPLFKNRKVCFIGAHPDDIELGCGALISSIAGTSHIFCVTLTDNQKNPQNKNLKNEHHKSLTSLGVPKENIILANFVARNFFLSRQEICDYLFLLDKKYSPEIIFTHSFSDIHQDHEVVAKEVFRIFKQRTVFGFEVVSSSYNFTPNFFFEATEKDVLNKIEALRAYETYKEKYYFSTDILKSLLIRNGALIGKKYAETYDIIRLISFQ